VVRLVAAAGGGWLGTADGEALHLWRLPEMRLSARILGMEGLDFAPRLALSSDGQQAAAWVAATQTLWLWPDAAGRPYALTPPDRAPQHLIGFDAQGALLWVDAAGDVLRGADDAVRVGSLRAPPQHVSGDGSRGFLLWGLDPAWLRCRDDATPHAGPPCTLARLDPFWGRWRPDAAPLGVADLGLILAPRGPEVWALDLSAAQLGASLAVSPTNPHARLCALAVSPDGRWLVTATTDAPALRWWSLPDGALARVTHLPPALLDPTWPQATLAAAFSDPLTLWVLLPEQRLLRIDAQSGMITGTWIL
jgi:hypothetical protein